MNKECAPVLVGVYDRLDHFKQCIESLKRNNLASETDLFIASDCSSMPGNHAVDAVREYCGSIDGFKSVNLILRETNFGAEKNYSTAIDYIFETYDRMILMEDDVVTSKYFLDFINAGLDKYYDNPEIVGVCGYLFPGCRELVHNPFFLKRRIPYGYGFWRNKEMLLDKARGPLSRLAIKDWSVYKNLTSHTPHLARNLPFIVEGDFSPLDMKTSIVMRIFDLYALYPSVSLTRNIGQDGSGVNCYADKEIQGQIIDDARVDLDSELEVLEHQKYSDYLTRRWMKSSDSFVNTIIFAMYNYVPGFYHLYRSIWLIYRSVKRKLM